jgi:hypothetical protein
VHDGDERALKWGEIPAKPIWLNWKDVVEQYTGIVGIRNKKVKVKHPTKTHLGKRSQCTASGRDQSEDSDSCQTMPTCHTTLSSASLKKPARQYSADKVKEKWLFDSDMYSSSEQSSVCSYVQTDIAIGLD